MRCTRHVTSLNLQVLAINRGEEMRVLSVAVELNASVAQGLVRRLKSHWTDNAGMPNAMAVRT